MFFPPLQLLGCTKGPVDWALGEPTSFETTQGWLQTKACEALLQLGHDPHVLDEMRYDEVGEGLGGCLGVAFHLEADELGNDTVLWYCSFSV